MPREGEKDKSLIEARRDMVQNFMAARLSIREMAKRINISLAKNGEPEISEATIGHDVKVIKARYQKIFEKDIKQQKKDGLILLGNLRRNSDVRIKMLMSNGTPTAMRHAREEEEMMVDKYQEFGLIPKNLGELTVHNTHELLTEIQERFKNADSQKAEGDVG